MPENLKLAEMLCTRFCHDIIGPVGAVNNGAEFLREELKNMHSQAADLIESSAKEAVARVQFYRQAYGLGSNAGSASLTEMRELAVNFFAASKIKLDWSEAYTDMAPINVSHMQKKVILNLLVIAAAVLIRGGKITFTIEANIAKVVAEGEKAALAPNIEACLRGELPESEIDPRLIQCHYTTQLAREAGTHIEISKNQDGAAFIVKL